MRAVGKALLVCASIHAMSAAAQDISPAQSKAIELAKLAQDVPATPVLRSTSERVAKTRALDALALRSPQTLTDVLESQSHAFPNSDLLEIYNSRDAAEAALPLAIRDAMNSSNWERSHLAYIIGARHTLMRRDNIQAMEHIKSAMDVVPSGAAGHNADDARFENYNYLMTLHALDRDLESAVEAAENIVAIAQRSGRATDLVTVIFNLADLFATWNDVQTADALMTAARDLPAAAYPAHKLLLDYGQGRIKARSGDYQAAVQILEDVVENAESPVMAAFAHSWIAYSAARGGNSELARRHLTDFYAVDLDPNIASRADINLTAARANIAASENDAAQAARLFNEALDLRTRAANAEAAKERASAREALHHSQALATERQANLELRAQSAEDVASRARERSQSLQIMLGIIAAAGLILALLYVRIRRLASERAKLLAKLKVEKERALQGEKAKERFLAIVGHETRTPLNAILPVLELLKDRQSDPTTESLVACGVLQARTLTNMMSDISTLTAGVGDKLVDSRDHADPRQILQPVFHAFKENTEAAGLNLHFIDTTGGCSAYLDANKLADCFRSILDNAIKFTESGSITCTLSALPGGVFSLTVADTGCGIPAESLEELRQPFTQADMSITRKRDGLGIGLAVVDTLVEVMGGRVQISSTTGQGTNVAIEIPGAYSTEVVEFAA